MFKCLQIMCAIYCELRCMFYKNFTLLMLARAYRSKLALFSVSGFKDEKLMKKETYMKTETCKLYSRDF